MFAEVAIRMKCVWGKKSEVEQQRNRKSCSNTRWKSKKKMVLPHKLANFNFFCNTTCKSTLGNIRISVCEEFYILKAWKQHLLVQLVFVHKVNAFQPDEWNPGCVLQGDFFKYLSRIKSLDLMCIIRFTSTKLKLQFIDVLYY